MRSDQLRSVKIRSVKVRSVEVRSVEVRSVEVRSVEVRSVEFRSVEVRSVEVRSVEVMGQLLHWRTSCLLASSSLEASGSPSEVKPYSYKAINLNTPYVVTLRPELPRGKDSRAPRVIHPTKGGHEPEPEPKPPPDLMI